MNVNEWGRNAFDSINLDLTQEKTKIVWLLNFNLPKQILIAGSRRCRDWKSLIFSRKFTVGRDGAVCALWLPLGAHKFLHFSHYFLERVDHFVEHFLQFSRVHSFVGVPEVFCLTLLPRVGFFRPFRRPFRRSFRRRRSGSPPPSLAAAMGRKQVKNTSLLATDLQRLSRSSASIERRRKPAERCVYGRQR